MSFFSQGLGGTCRYCCVLSRLAIFLDSVIQLFSSLLQSYFCVVFFFPSYLPNGVGDSKAKIKAQTSTEISKQS